MDGNNGFFFHSLFLSIRCNAKSKFVCEKNGSLCQKRSKVCIQNSVEQRKRFSGWQLPAALHRRFLKGRWEDFKKSPATQSNCHSTRMKDDIPESRVPLWPFPYAPEWHQVRRCPHGRGSWGWEQNPNRSQRRLVSAGWTKSKTPTNGSPMKPKN